MPSGSEMCDALRTRGTRLITSRTTRLASSSREARGDRFAGLELDRKRELEPRGLSPSPESKPASPLALLPPILTNTKNLSRFLSLSRSGTLILVLGIVYRSFVKLLSFSNSVKVISRCGRRLKPFQRASKTNVQSKEAKRCKTRKK